MLKKDFGGERFPETGIKIRPMQKDDSYEMIGMAGMAAGHDLRALKTQYEMHIDHSFVAIDADRKMIGFILGAVHPAEFPNGIGMVNLVVDPHQENPAECSTFLVSALAQHCLDHGQHSIDLIVFNNDPKDLALCHQFAARKRGTHKGSGNDGQEFTADFYTISDLAGKFRPVKSINPEPKI